MLTSTLRRDRSNCALEDFQQGLLNTLTRNITRYGRVIWLARDFIYLIDIDDPAACAVNIEVSCLQQLEQDIFYVLANITSLSQGSRVSNRKRNIQHARKCLCEVGLTGTGWPQHQDIGLGNLHVLIFVGLTAAGSSCGLRLFCLDALVVVIYRYR